MPCVGAFKVLKTEGTRRPVERVLGFSGKGYFGQGIFFGENEDYSATPYTPHNISLGDNALCANLPNCKHRPTHLGCPPITRNLSFHDMTQ